MTATRFVQASGDPRIDGLLFGYVGANGTVSLVAWVGPLDFGFPTDSGAYAPSPQTPGFQPFTGGPAEAATPIWAGLRAFAEVSQVSGLVTTWNAATPGAADIRLGLTSTGIGYAFAYLPPFPGSSGGRTDAWFNAAFFDSIPLGSGAYQTVLHEVGHTLGLKHGHEIDLGIAALPDEFDTQEFSVMTYSGSFNVGAPQSLMMLDIAALQYLYGANFTARSEDTVYRFDPVTAEMSINGVGQGVPRSGSPGGFIADLPVHMLLRTIWDGGGIDTYDFSDYGPGQYPQYGDAGSQFFAVSMRIDLRPGEWTDVDVTSAFQAAVHGGPANGGYARGQLANALLYQGDPRSLIENAIAGSGDDMVIGNVAANRLEGRDGNDSLSGDAGDDTLVGGAGNDLLDGGSGFDTADYSAAASRVVVNLGQAGPQDTQGAGIDTLVSIESIIGTDFNDRIVGSPADNIILLGKGNDVVFASAGLDVIDGGEGTDTIDYRAMMAAVVAELLPPGASGAGLANIENINGSNFADLLRGNAANNVLAGLGGDDILEGGQGGDRLDGGDGPDLASYASAPGAVKVYLNSASATGSAGIDYFVSIEGFVGSDFNDTLVGNNAANVLRGGAGNDRLYGLDGDDVLRGGLGDDLFYGGLGSDTADYSDATVTVRAVLGTGGTVNTTNFGRDRYFDIENLAGGQARDFLTGDGNANILTGNAGNDIIAGMGGNDTLRGGEGNDDLSGGLGADRIELGPGNDIVRYASAADSRIAAMDTIVGFTASGPGFDRIGFENAAGALFAGVAPIAILLNARIVLASAFSLADLDAQLGILAESTAAALSVTQVTVEAGAVAGDYIAVNDQLAGFNAATDMLIGIQFAVSATLGAGNLFLF